MIETGQLLGWIAFFLLGIWRLYWYLSEQKTEAEKPKEVHTLSVLSKRTFSKLVTIFSFGIVGVQLLGVAFFDMPTKSLSWQIVGFLLVLVGLGVAVIGRYNLGSNWANCYEYQVKRKQELVTHGIYKYIRHPLYTGIVLFLIGSELLVQSYLVYVSFFTFIAANVQAKWEEELLVKHYGKRYQSYMNRTRRFIPFLW